MGEIDVPSYFLCPISLEIMRDPVILSTGITYDRPSIEKWLFSAKHSCCPVTKQILIHSKNNGSEDDDDFIITPNHTLRRVIQSWCNLNASHGVERFPTPKPPVTKSQLSKLLNDAAANPSSVLSSSLLRTLRSIAAESDANKRCMKASGVVDFLVSTIIFNTNSNNMLGKAECSDTACCNAKPRTVDDDTSTCGRTRDEAVIILCHLKISDSGIKSLLRRRQKHQDCNNFTDSLIEVLRRGSYEARACAVLLLKSMIELVDSSSELSGFSCTEFLAETVGVLRDRISQQSTKAALELLIHLCTLERRNRMKAVEAGAVGVLVEILVEESEKGRVIEMALVGLDILCGCAEGRAELVGHGAGLAAVSKKVMRVSATGSERAVRVILGVAKYKGSSALVVKEMVEVGVVAKMCLVVQVGVGVGGNGYGMMMVKKTTKEMAAEILRLLDGKAWKNSTCIPPGLISS